MMVIESMFKTKTMLMLPGCFILKDLGHASLSLKVCSMGHALKLGGPCKRTSPKVSSCFRPEAADRMASPPLLSLFPHCSARSPHQEQLAAQWREACQQSSRSVYGASCFLGILRSFISFCLGFSWSSC